MTLRGINNASVLELQSFSQEFKGKEVYQEDFIRFCVSLMANYHSLPNYPWSMNANPVAIFRQYGIRKLGAKQIAFINYMHSNFFMYSNPLFLKHDYIAKKLKISRTRVVKIISDLESLGIILKIRNATKFDGCRTIILPSIGYIINSKNKRDFNGNVIEREIIRCDILKDKYSKLFKCKVSLLKLLVSLDKKNSIYITL